MPWIRFALPPSGKNGSVGIEPFHHWTTTEVIQSALKLFVECCPHGSSAEKSWRATHWPQSMASMLWCILLLKYLFGVNVCPRCPRCARTRTACIDRAGSSATVTGGVFGRVDAVYISFEAQKSTGSLHAHCQVFVQCLHQHTPLTEIFGLVETRLDALRAAYLQYNAHVVHATYSGQTKEEIDARIADAERTWPEHAADSTMTGVPALPTSPRNKTT